MGVTNQQWKDLCQDMLDKLEAERNLLDWYERNPRAVVHSTGYCGAADSWCWRDKDLVSHDAEGLRDAIRKAMAASQPQPTTSGRDS